MRLMELERNQKRKQPRRSLRRRLRIAASLITGVAALWFQASCESPTTISTREPAGLHGTSTSYGQDSSREYFEAPEAASLRTRAEFFGRDIWMKATGGNERFHMYSMGQRIGDHNMNFWRFLQSKKRGSRFDEWGLLNDPDCCTPGDVGCPKKSLKETFGMDYCPGDDAILAAVGRPENEYRDSACDLDTHLGKLTQGAQSACDLRFGTSAGAVGFRKFPNPRFNRERWLKIQGNADDSWDGYDRQIGDASIEPPFRIGVACASCHAGFDPVRPPLDKNHPKWFNIKSTVGNQYLYAGQIFGAGFALDSIEWQMHANSRPGTVDTSAVPNDQIHNPGTMNAIVNFSKRPVFNETVNSWRRVSACDVTANEDVCTCNEAGARCYEKSRRKENVLHVLKGGEDAIGIDHALLRVYMNTGTCAEKCWLNHLSDLRVFDSSQRGYAQTPFNIGQCRRDCPNYRALEDRVDVLRGFILSAGPSDLYEAKNLARPEDVIPYIETTRGFGTGAVARGKQIYTQNCASCHSSQKNSQDYLARDDKGRRIDWLGSDERIPAKDVGTYECRARHSNHERGHVWQEYSSENYQAKGAGAYRAISLINVWATAPFLHNNAVGPEICGKNSEGFYTGNEACTPFDPNVEGRLKLYEASMQALLNPEQRGQKRTLTSSEIRFQLTPRIGKRGMALVIPKGINVSRIGGFRHKDFFADLLLAAGNKLTLGLVKTPEAKKTLATEVLRQVLEDIRRSKTNEVYLRDDTLKKLGETYSNCSDLGEDKGHTYGAELSAQAKKDLTAFMETF